MSHKPARLIGQRILTDELIAERAYQKWLERGRPNGDGREDWFAARADLIRERSQSVTRKRYGERA